MNKWKVNEGEGKAHLYSRMQTNKCRKIELKIIICNHNSNNKFEQELSINVKVMSKIMMKSRMFK